MKWSLPLLVAALAIAIAWKMKRSETSIKPDPITFTPVFCQPSFDPSSLDGVAPIFEGLGNLNFTVSTQSKKAQQLFNQGLTLIYAFNHNEAARSFNGALKEDSTIAMAYWGIAMVLGPNYNAALDPSLLAQINQALDKAMVLSTHASEKEKQLILALRQRFPLKEVSDMSNYNAAYSRSMASVFMNFPNDSEVAAIYTDALMNEHPWNFWLKDGSPQPWTMELVRHVEQQLQKFPNHPAILHMYIHLMEASRDAAKALTASYKLGDMLPAAGHLVHMPSHIYIRTGKYHDGVIANEKATLADSSYVAQCKVQGVYPMMYYPHNIHFLAACAFLEGSSVKALKAAWMIARKSDKKYIFENPTVQHYSIIPYYVLVQLAKWNEVLSLPKPPDSLEYPLAIWHYARGQAFAAAKNFNAAMSELKSLVKFSKDPKFKELLIWENNSVAQILEIAQLVLSADILAGKGETTKAIDLLMKAVAIEDQLNYTEPPDWFFSVRLTLGEMLNRAGRFDEALKIYEEDMINLPENGWALKGMENSYKGLGNQQKLKETRLRFEKAWQWSDIEINSSRIY